MTEIIMVELDQIRANPFQMREGEDAGAIEELAMSIRRSGLMQNPLARPKAPGYELVFGHTRLAAFRLLATKGIPTAGIEADAGRWGQMPLQIAEGLADRQMFELALSENVKRKDLNPVETARALQRYMDEFGATSEEAGELFGLAGATVRGKVRLLDLPETVLEKVGSGELPEGAARKLLTLQRVTTAEAVSEATDDIVAGEDFEEVIENQLMRVPGVIQMQATWQNRGEDPKAGDGLWLLKTPADKFPAVEAPGWAQALKALGMDSNAKNRELVEDWIAQLQAGALIQELPTVDSGEMEKLERLAHLLKPPGCYNCPFYAKADGAHYCGFDACHKSKKAAWLADVLAKASKALGIPIYDKAVDGALKTPAEKWSHNKEFKERHEDLRLLPGSVNNYTFKDVPLGGKVVFVGKKAKAIQAAESKKNQRREEAETWEERQARRSKRVNAVEEVIWEKAVPVFVPMVADLKSIAVLEMLVDGSREKKPAKSAPHKEKLAYLHRALTNKLLTRVIESWGIENEKDWMERRAKHLVGMAKEWGVKLPADWMAQAKVLQAELDASMGIGVAAETEKPAKKKKAKAEAVVAADAAT